MKKTLPGLLIRHRHTRTLNLALHALLVTVTCLGLLALHPSAATGAQAKLTPQELRTPGVYAVANNGLVSVASGRISATLGDSRAERLAGEQALRKAKQQLALHLYKDKLDGSTQYSVNIGGARIINREKHDNTVFVALLADPGQVSLVPRSPLEDFQEVNVAPLVEDLLTRAPIIADGGGMVFDLDGGWVGLGVGYAALPDNPDAESISKARTVARVAAAEALTNFIFGVQINVNTEQHEIYATGPGGDLFKEWAKTSMREEITGTLNSAQFAGEWITDDAHIGVAVLVGRPPVDLAFTDESETAPDNSGTIAETEKPLLHKSDIPLPWQRNINARSWVLSGGVTICKHDGVLYALAVESGKLKGNAAHDRMQLPTLIDAKARSQITRYLMGFSSNTVTRSEELKRADLTSEAVAESLNKISREGVSGVVSGIQRLGSWYSEDEKTLFQAFVVPLP